MCFVVFFIVVVVCCVVVVVVVFFIAVVVYLSFWGLAMREFVDLVDFHKKTKLEGAHLRLARVSRPKQTNIG